MPLFGILGVACTELTELGYRELSYKAQSHVYITLDSRAMAQSLCFTTFVSFFLRPALLRTVPLIPLASIVHLKL